MPTRTLAAPSQKIGEESPRGGRGSRRAARLCFWVFNREAESEARRFIAQTGQFMASRGQFMLQIGRFVLAGRPPRPSARDAGSPARRRSWLRGASITGSPGEGEDPAEPLAGSATVSLGRSSPLPNPLSPLILYFCCFRTLKSVNSKTNTERQSPPPTRSRAPEIQRNC